MKPIKEQLNKLPYDIRERAKRYINCSLEDNKPMKKWFDWSSTSEGYNYWELVSKMYKL